MISVPLLALVEALALGLRSSNRNSTAGWVLASSLVLMLGLIVVEFPAQFTPATYEAQQLRQATLSLHLKLAAVALVISVLAIASLRSPSSWGRRFFWAGWSLNLTVLAVIVYMEATGRLFCC